MRSRQSRRTAPPLLIQVSSFHRAVFQAENGLLVTATQGQNTLDAPETLLRVGVASGTELRFTVPNYFYNVTTRGGPGSGFGDLTLGLNSSAVR